MKPDLKTAAICGLFCGTCPSYPTLCHGCLSDVLNAECRSCPNGFRDCAKAHTVTRCNECNEFPCERLKTFSTKHIENGICHHENVIKDLTLINEIGAKAWVECQTKENTCKNCGKLIYWHEKNLHTC